MTDLRVITSDGGDRILEEAAVQAFAENLRGPLLRPGDEGYDQARKVWNGMIDRRPALIARCAGVADVMTAVRFARTNGVLVSVKGGGHNITGNAVCEGGLMIDLSPMKSVRVDPIKRITTCPLDLAAHGVRLCPLHRRVDNALAAVEKAFRSTTLAELLAEPTSSKPLCEFPNVS